MKKTNKTALTFLKPYRIRVFLAPLLKIVECITELAVPFIVRSVIDQGLTEPSIGEAYGSHYGDTKYILGLTSLIFVFAIVGFGCTMITQYLAAHVSSEYAYTLKKELYDHLTHASSKQVENYGKGKALNLLTNDSFSMQNGVQLFMRLMVRAPFLVLGSVAAAFFINVYAGLAVLGGLSLCALTIFIVMKLTPKEYSTLQKELDRVSTLGDDAIVGGRVVRAFNKQEDEIASFQKESEKYRKQALRIQKMNSFINPLTFGFVNAAIVLILYFGSFQIQLTGLSVGSIVALVSFLTQSLTALIQFTRLVTSISKALASKKRIDAFFALTPDIVDGPLKATKKETKTLFRFEDVRLSFGGENDALSHINFELCPGETIGIIGGTGSGKSTILSLCNRFLDASGGQVYFQDEPIQKWNLHTLRDQIALVSQKPQIFQGTIRDNLLLGNPHASEEEIKAAIQDSLCSEYFCHYKDGLDHPIEEGGANLSGGQKQRLLIGRALLSKRPILMLDDSTSALDYKSDLLVRENIKKRGGLSVILVSQRATSIQNCDRIYVLDKGHIVGVGKHEELLTSCPVYSEIYHAQVDAQ